jgi:hypothetical protein
MQPAEREAMAAEMRAQLALAEQIAHGSGRRVLAMAALAHHREHNPKKRHELAAASWAIRCALAGRKRIVARAPIPITAARADAGPLAATQPIETRGP